MGNDAGYDSLLDRFSVFACTRTVGAPIRGLPIFGEVLWTVPASPKAEDRRFEDAWFRALEEVPLLDDHDRENSATAVAQALTEVFSAETRDTMTSWEYPTVIEFFERVVKCALEELAGQTFHAMSVDQICVVLVSRIRQVAEQDGLDTLVAQQTEPAQLRVPLGLVATDGNGYASFDLTRVRRDVRQAIAGVMYDEATTRNRTDSIALLVHPFGGEGPFDALPQRRFTENAVVMRLFIDQPDIPADVVRLGLPSMQSVGLTDWRLSPASIATTTSAMIGADGCQTLLPPNSAIDEFSFYTVVGISDPAAAAPEAHGAQLRAAYVNEHRLSWTPLGHSLGRIIQTFPLAPGEAIRVAVVEWTRRDKTIRDETTKVDESVVHELRRDRVIGETVRAGVEEWQRGGSVMGGLANSVGGAFGYGGLGVSAGNSNALGGSYSTSSGSRDIAAETNQRLSERVAQASAASRELYSTTVVQSAQAERSAVETRVIANYNHSHTVTFLYHEIYRQFRLAAEFVRRRPAILVPLKTDWLDGPAVSAAVVKYRPALERSLLDERFTGGFDAIERLRARGGALADLDTPLPEPPPQATAALPEPHFFYFTFEIRTGGLVAEDFDHKVDLYSIVLGLPEGHCQLVTPGDGQPQQVMNNRGAFRHKDAMNRFTVFPQWTRPSSGATLNFVPWGLMSGIMLHVACHPGDDKGADVSLSYIKISGVDARGQQDAQILFEQDYSDGHLVFQNNESEKDRMLVLPVRRPTPPAPPAPYYSAADLADRAAAAALLEHLRDNRRYYSRGIFFALDIYKRADLLASIALSDGSTVLDHVANEPLEILGDHVAFPCTDSRWAFAIDEALARSDAQLVQEEIPVREPVSVERLVTLPSRGVFADAKLGNCNISEEIDNTRFWDWQQSPIPLVPTEIAPVQLPVPQYQAPQGTTPTALPDPLAEVKDPPPAPDPTGLSAALSALTTANIFRDMSGTAQIADLLKQLSDNSVAIAQTAKAAQPTAGVTAAPIMGGQSTPPQPTASVQSADGKPGSPASTPQAVPVTMEQRQAQDIANQLSKLHAAQQYYPPKEQAEIREAVKPSLMNASYSPGGDLAIGAPPAGAGATIPAGGLTITINTAQDEIDLGFIRMTKAHLFVEAVIDSQPKTPDADKPVSFGLVPVTGQGGAADRPPQPGQSGKPGSSSTMRWFNLGPSTYKWRFWRGTSETGPDWKVPPVRSSLVGTLRFTESDTWPA
ncbi:hypothetical protein [Nocardia sp. NPDC003979]